MSALLLFCFAALFGASPPTQAAASSSLKYPAAVEINSPKRYYRQSVHSLKHVDFKNLDYFLYGERFHLRNGSAEGHKVIAGTTEATERFDIGLDHVWYFDFQDHQPRRALVFLSLEEAAGSSSDTGFVLLFEIVDGHPTIIRQFAYDLQAPGTESKFNPKTGLLTIKARAKDGSSHCCPENLETAVFKWQADSFKLIHRDIASLTNTQ